MRLTGLNKGAIGFACCILACCIILQVAAKSDHEHEEQHKPAKSKIGGAMIPNHSPKKSLHKSLARSINHRHEDGGRRGLGGARSMGARTKKLSRKSNKHPAGGARALKQRAQKKGAANKARSLSGSMRHKRDAAEGMLLEEEPGRRPAMVEVIEQADSSVPSSADDGMHPSMMSHRPEAVDNDAHPRTSWLKSRRNALKKRRPGSVKFTGGINVDFGIERNEFDSETSDGVFKKKQQPVRMQSLLKSVVSALMSVTLELRSALAGLLRLQGVSQQQQQQPITESSVTAPAVVVNDHEHQLPVSSARQFPELEATKDSSIIPVLSRSHLNEGKGEGHPFTIFNFRNNPDEAALLRGRRDIQSEAAAATDVAAAAAADAATEEGYSQGAEVSDEDPELSKVMAEVSQTMDKEFEQAGGPLTTGDGEPEGGEAGSERPRREDSEAATALAAESSPEETSVAAPPPAAQEAPEAPAASTAGTEGAARQATGEEAPQAAAAPEAAEPEAARASEGEGEEASSPKEGAEELGGSSLAELAKGFVEDVEQEAKEVAESIPEKLEAIKESTEEGIEAIPEKIEAIKEKVLAKVAPKKTKKLKWRRPKKAPKKTYYYGMYKPLNRVPYKIDAPRPSGPVEPYDNLQEIEAKLAKSKKKAIVYGSGAGVSFLSPETVVSFRAPEESAISRAQSPVASAYRYKQQPSVEQLAELITNAGFAGLDDLVKAKKPKGGEWPPAESSSRQMEELAPEDSPQAGEGPAAAAEVTADAEEKVEVASGLPQTDGVEEYVPSSAKQSKVKVYPDMELTKLTPKCTSKIALLKVFLKRLITMISRLNERLRYIKSISSITSEVLIKRLEFVRSLAIEARAAADTRSLQALAVSARTAGVELSRLAGNSVCMRLEPALSGFLKEFRTGYLSYRKSCA